ncbi:MAG: MFS transporter, partial [Planctomycetota bacterium]
FGVFGGFSDVHWVGLLAALALFGDSALYVLLPAHRGALGLTAMQVGILLSANRFVRLGLNDPTARVVDRFGLRAPMTIALLLAAVTTAAYGHVGFVAFLVLRIVWGLSWSFIRNSANFAVLREEPARRGELQGSFRSLARIGSLATVVVGAWLAGKYGFTRACEILGVATVPGVLLALLVLRRAPLPASPHFVGGGGQEGGAKGSIAVAFAAFFANAFGASILLVTLGEGLKSSSSTLLGLAGAGRWIGEIFVAPFAGKATDRFGRAPVIAMSGLLGAGALGGCGVARSPEQYVACSMFAFAMLSALQTALDALATDRAGSSTVALGRYFTVVDVATAIGALVGPPLVEAIGYPKTAACSAVVVAVVAGAYIRGSRSESGADHARLHADG